jgi:serine/threonine-protein phosphatase 4 regulatory subunit 1
MQEQEIETYFKSGYIGAYKDSSVRIKKEIIHSSSIIAKSVTKEFLNKEIIDQFFTDRCKETVWGIRKACVEILPQLVILTETKKEHLAHLLLNFIKDGNKMVKISAYKVVPEFIANYNSSKVP